MKWVVVMMFFCLFCFFINGGFCLYWGIKRGKWMIDWKIVEVFDFVLIEEMVCEVIVGLLLEFVGFVV